MSINKHSATMKLEHLILINYKNLENHNWMKYRMQRYSGWSNNFSLCLSYPAEALDSLKITQIPYHTIFHPALMFYVTIIYENRVDLFYCG